MDKQIGWKVKQPAQVYKCSMVEPDYNTSLHVWSGYDFCIMSIVSRRDKLSTCQHRTYFSSVESLSLVRLFATPWIAARQASLSITNSWSLLKLMPIQLVMPSNHLILCCPLLLLPPILPSIRVFSSESTLLIRWPKYWSFSFSISPSNEHPGLNLLQDGLVGSPCRGPANITLPQALTQYWTLY